MKKSFVLLTALIAINSYCFADSSGIYENKTRLTNEEIAKNTIGVFKAEIEPLKEEIKSKLEESISKSLTKNGYKIIEITLDSTTKSEMARASIKVTKPIKNSKKPYNEIQDKLAEIQKICVKASTLDGKCHLENMSKFIYIYEKNSYKYVKTLLK